MDRDPIEARFRPAALMAALVASGVEFVVVGGVAVTVHGYERFTADLDLVPSPEPENLRRLAVTLDSIREGDAEVTENAMDAPHVVIATEYGRADVIRHLDGLPAYTELRDRSIEVRFDGSVTVRVCSKEDLVAMKRAAGRPRDALDVMYLTDGDG